MEAPSPTARQRAAGEREMRLSHEMNVKLMQTTRQSRSFRNWVWAEAAAKVGHFPLSQNQRRCPHRVSSDIKK